MNISECPSGYFNYNKTCNKCKDGCASCDALDFGHTCHKCKEEKLLYQNQCFDECPVATFKTPDNLTCMDCTSYCIECIYKNNSNHDNKIFNNKQFSINDSICKQCSNGYSLENNKCINICRKGKFQNNENNRVCEKCLDKNCELCLSAEICKKCKPETFLFEKENENRCLDECPHRFYKNVKNQKCEKCLDNCKFCTDNHKCISCNSGFYIYNGVCVSDCPSGYGILDESCVKCGEEDCLNCRENDINECKECKKGKFLFRGKCSDEDACYANNQYANVKRNKCSKCDPMCKVCLDKNTCLECYNDFQITPKKKFLKEIEDGLLNPNITNKYNFKDNKNNTLLIDINAQIDYFQCKNECSDNKVINSDTNSCVCCKDPLCKICTNNGENCNSCSLESGFYQGTCHKSCPLGNFIDIVKGSCKKCIKHCDKCNDNLTCDYCSYGYYLNEKKNCVKTCPDKFYADLQSRQCLKCDSSCEICINEKNNYCEFCAEGYSKFQNVCLKGSECPKGSYNDSIFRECSPCKIPNCLECKNSYHCLECKENYSLSKDKTECILKDKYIELIDNPNMFSKYQIENGASKGNYSLSGDLRVSCYDLKTFSTSFWLRVITDDIKDNSNFLEISHPFYEDYLMKNKTLDYDENKYLYPGFYISLKIKRIENKNHHDENIITPDHESNIAYKKDALNQNEIYGLNHKSNLDSLERKIISEKLNNKNIFQNHLSSNNIDINQHLGNITHHSVNKTNTENISHLDYIFENKVNYHCLATIMYVNSKNKVIEINTTNEFCKFLMLKEWTLVVLSLNQNENKKFSFKFMMYDSQIPLSYNSTSEILDEILLRKDISIITKDSFVSLDKDYSLKFVPIFEISKFKIHEYIISEENLKKMYTEKPLSCDINCVECKKDLCIQCKNKKKPKNGYCTPTYLSISKNILHLNKPKNFNISDLSSNLLYKYFASNRYTFMSFFYIRNSDLLMSENEIILFKAHYYNGVSLIEISLSGGNLLFSINGKYLKQDIYNISSDTWYGVNISIEKDIFYINLRDTNNQDLIKYSHPLDIDQYLMRLTHDVEFYFYGGFKSQTSVENDFTIYDARIYINNIDLDMPFFSCGEHCEFCNKNIECQKCENGYNLDPKNKNNCILSNVFNPFLKLRRKSLYDYESNILDYPNKYDLQTISLWMRKLLPGQSVKKVNLLSIINPVTEIPIPIFWHDINENGEITYKVDLDGIKEYSSSNGTEVDDNYHYIEDDKENSSIFIRERVKMRNVDDSINNKNNFFRNHLKNRQFVDNSNNNKSLTKFNYTVKYNNNTFNYFHIGIIFQYKAEKNKIIMTFSIFDSYANLNFTTKTDINLAFLHLNELLIGDDYQPQIDMAYGPIKYYKGNLLADQNIYKKLVTKTIPKECDTSCRVCDYDTGKCLVCASSKINDRKCDTFYFGFTKSINYKKNEREISQSSKSKNEKNTRYNTNRMNTIKENSLKTLNSKLKRNSFNQGLLRKKNELQQLENGNQNNTSNYNYFEKQLDVNDRNNFDLDFSTSFSEFFDTDINSLVYGVLGWIYMVDKPNFGRENIIFRLSNSDYDKGTLEDDPNYVFEAGLNLITLKAKYTSNAKDPEFVFVVADGNKDIEIKTGKFLKKNNWYFISCYKDVEKLSFEYSILNNNEKFQTTEKYNLTYCSEPVQEITSLKLFGVDSVPNSKLDLAKAVAYNLYMVPNLFDNKEIIESFLNKIDPTKPDVFNKCSIGCAPGNCILDVCLKCNDTYYLSNDHCFKKESNDSYTILIDQTNFNIDSHVFDIDSSLIRTGSYNIGFYIRRNFYPRSMLLELQSNDALNKLTGKLNREILSFGKVKIDIINSLSNVKLNVDIDSKKFENCKKKNNIITSEIVYQSDDIVDFEWFYINLFMNSTDIFVNISKASGDNDDITSLQIKHENVLTEFSKIYVNGLDYEFSIFGLVISQTETKMLQRPNIDCPIDCTFCDVFPNNICLKCDYGNQCTLNSSRNNLCTFRIISLPDIYLWKFDDKSKDNFYNHENTRFEVDDNKRVEVNNNGVSLSNEDIYLNKLYKFSQFFTVEKQKLFEKNYITFSSLYGKLLNKYVRFRSFTLFLTVSIDIKKGYDSIVKILNYDREKESNTKLKDLGEYMFMDLQFDSSQKIFKFSYVNKNNILNNMEKYKTTYNIQGYANKNSLNQYHYIAISYNQDQKLFSFVILNSKDNYIIDNLSTSGNMDYMGIYTHLIFGDNFKIVNNKNAESKIFDVNFMHETALNTLELVNHLQQSYDKNYILGCDSIDIRSNECSLCSEGMHLINGICVDDEIKNLEVYSPNKIVSNFFNIPEDINLNIDENFNDNQKSDIFSIQFKYLQIENQPIISGILKFSKVPKNQIVNCTSSEGFSIKNNHDLISVLQRENSLIFVLRPSSDPKEFVSFSIDNIYGFSESYSWIQVTATIDLNLQSFTVILYNYKTREINTSRFSYSKNFESKKTKLDSNLLKINKDQKFVFRFCFKKEKIKKEKQSINNLNIKTMSSSNISKYKLSSLIFFVGKEFDSKEINKFTSFLPVVCNCRCECINEICPYECRYENLWIKYNQEKDKFDKTTLFQNFFKILNKNSKEEFEKSNSQVNSIYNKQINTTIESNSFKKISISFKVDFKKLIGLVNKWISQVLNNKLVVKLLKDSYHYDKYLPELEKSKDKNGIYDVSYNSKTKQFLKVLIKAYSVKSFKDLFKKDGSKNENILKNGFNGENLRYIFSLSDNQNAYERKNEKEIKKKIISKSILTIEATMENLIIYVGGNKFSDILFKRKLDYQIDNSIQIKETVDLYKIEQIYFYLNLDMSNKLLKVILFLNDMRKDFEFKYTHETDLIEYFTAIYTNPTMEDLLINVGETSIESHLDEIKSKIIKRKFQKKFCSKNCNYCFVGSKKYLTKCLVCGEDNAMYNNNCMKSRNFKQNKNAALRILNFKGKKTYNLKKERN